MTDHRTVVLAATLIIMITCWGCTAPPRQEEAAAETNRFDPAGGEYPQVLWMCRIYEVPVATTEVAVDGLLRAAPHAARRNGIGVVPAESVSAVFESIRRLPGSTYVASPALFVRPGGEGVLDVGARDKAGASIGARRILVRCDLTASDVRAEVEIENADPGWTVGCGTGDIGISEAGALVFLCPAAEAEAPATLLVARPSIIRSIEDHPFQRATAHSVTER